MKKTSFFHSRDTKWLGGKSPASATIVGAIIALTLIAPLVLATFLERQFGDAPTLFVLGGIVLVSAGFGYVLSKMKFALLPVVLLALNIGCIFSLYITTAMNW